MPTILPAVLIAIMFGVFVAACGGDTVTPSTGAPDTEATQVPQESAGLPIWRKVNSGWVSPSSEQAASAFSRELRADVITSEEEMELFNKTVVGKRTYGTGQSLGLPEFPGSVVLVAYLLWLPVQGDPLSVVGLEIEGNTAVVDLELDDDAQGRELPYLYAPMTMVTVDRSRFPAQGPVEFQFRLDDEVMATVSDNLK